MPDSRSSFPSTLFSDNITYSATCWSFGEQQFGSCLIGPRPRLRAPLLEALRLSLRQSSSFPSCGRRRPHSFTVLTVATRHPFRRCPDSVCDTLTGHRVVRAHASCGAGGTGAGAARGGPGKMRREAHPSIPIPPRRSTVATFLQPSLSASSAIRPRLIGRPSSSPSPATRLASIRTRS